MKEGERRTAVDMNLIPDAHLLATQRCVLFHSDLTTKPEELGTATLESAGFMTNCTEVGGNKLVP